MSKLIALLHFLLALAGFGVGGTTWTSNLHDNGTTLHSQARAQDGVARFDCIDSSSGQCYYTLYASTCTGTTCTDAPLRRFHVARDDSRQFAGLIGFHPCVDTVDTVPGPDCRPRANATTY